MTERRTVGPPARTRLRAAGLTLPLVAFVGFSFLFPLGTMLSRSVYDPLVADTLPPSLKRGTGNACPANRSSRRPRGNSRRRSRAGSPAGSAGG